MTDSEGNSREVARGASETVDIPLGSGTWTVSVTVDDDAICEDVAADATCSTEVEIEREVGTEISRWKFDEDLQDSIDENHGVYGGLGEPAFVAGVDGSAIELNGTDSIVNVDQIEGLPLFQNPAFTIAMWVRGMPQADMRIWSEGSALDSGPLFNLGTDNTGQTGELDLFIRGPGGGIGHTHSTGIVFDGEWHHVAYTDEGGFAAMYIDGERDATEITYVRPVMELDTTSIGAIQRADPSHWFTGAIDDVRVFDYALTAAEIAAIADSGVIPEDEVCDNGTDDDGDGDIDCDDADCSAFPACVEEICNNALDDDGDGDTDCDDADCAASELCPGGVGPFVRADSNGDGIFNISDPSHTLNALFLGGDLPVCLAGADANGDGVWNVSDPSYELNFLFLGGPAPPAPNVCALSGAEGDLSLGCEQATCTP